MALVTGVAASAIRFYERKGLVRAVRSGGRRWFGAEDQRKLAIIAWFRRSGFSLKEIEGLLTRAEDGEVGWRAAARAARGRIEGEIRQRQALLRDLEPGRTCECVDPVDCAVTDRLIPRGEGQGLRARRR